jgi:hypothetical protein
MIPTPFALFVLVAAWWSTGERMPRTLLLCCLFGATAAVSLPALGGAPITPAVLLLPFLVWRALREEGIDACLQRLAYPRAGFWLLLVVLWGVFGAAFLPRLFEGDTLLFATERGPAASVRLLPLQPLATNLTQSAYALGSLCAFAALGVLLQGAGRLVRFGDAVLLLAAVNCAAALLNLAELHLGVPSLLALVRNAGYAILVGGDVGGLQRISGTFAETSTFSTFTLPLLAFCASLWRDGVRPRASGTLALLTLALLLLSTSSTAYATMAAGAGLLAAALAWRAMQRGTLLRLGGGAWLLWALAVAGCSLLLARPDMADRIGDFFSITLVRKLESSSGIERGSWNAQAWTNFTDLHGLGVGLGSARASSFALVLLSNLGLIGTTLFLAFTGRVLWPAAPSGDAPADAVARASRHAVLAVLVASCVSGTVFDLGLAFYAFAAAASLRAVATTAPNRSGVAHVRT